MGLVSYIRDQFSFINGNYRILVVSWIIMDFVSEMPNVNYQYFVRDILGGQGIALGLIAFVGFLAMAAVAFPGGYLADKYGRRWLITTMTFGMASSYLLFAFAPSWHFILIGTLLTSLCLIYQPALFSMVQDSLPPEKRGMGSSIIQLIHSTFNTPGPIVAGFLLLSFGLEWSMRIIYLLMTILFLTAAVWRLRLKETVVNKEPIRFRYFFSSYPKAMRESFGVWKNVPRSMLWLMITQILVMFGMAVMNVINALYARDILGIPENQWWLVFVPLLVTMIFASIPVGWTVDHFGRKIPLISGVLALAGGIVLFISGNLFTVMIAMVLFGFGSLMAMSAIMAWSTDLVTAENRGKVNGFTNFTGYIVMGLGSVLGNYFYVSSGIPALPFYLAFAAAVPALFITMFLVHEPQEQTDIHLRV